ncbi:hypothetical protein LguiA_019266 [Lonicera macranthoides]
MVCQTLPKLPIVDFTKENWKPGSSSWLLACKDVRQGLEELGCFVAIYDNVSLELDNEVLLSLKELFDLPLETKMQNSSHLPFCGYIGQIPVIPYYEGLDVENGTSLEPIQSFTNLMWPNGNDHFCETMQSYSKLLAELDQMVAKMIFESYGIMNYYDSHLESLAYMLRVNKYDVPETKETNVGLGVHTDKSFISVLHQNQVKGLEVKTKDGQWIDVEFPPSSFIIMAGEAFSAWSNGRVDPCVHRVTLSENKERYSIGKFSYRKGITEVPQELVDEEHPLQFKPFDCFGLLEFSLTKEGLQAKSIAKAYCGILET